ncbi:MAG: hypothetical protein M3M87_03585 [Thermoproteota archaeon]|nr:hypothetical protein [Thermoproteota archaeon]
MNKKNNKSNSIWTESRGRKTMRRSAIPLTAIVTTLAIVLSSPTTVQPAFAHADTILSVNIEDDEEQQQGGGIVVVVGHTNEPAYGAKPGIHDGLHGLEVTISDNATGLPIGDAQLRADKYYFADLESFNSAASVEDADEIEEGINVGEVFGETGSYLARQVVADGIYGYRLYGNISYFGTANVTIDSTIFCSTPDQEEGGDTTKFNSPGWSGSFGCPQDIDTIAFPTNNTALTGLG